MPSGVDPAVVGLDGEGEGEGEGVEGGDVKRRRVGDHTFGGGSGSGSGRVALAKGESAFLNNAKNAGVIVIRAPKGLSRRRENTSKWNTRFAFLFRIFRDEGGSLISILMQTQMPQLARRMARPVPSYRE